MLVDGGLDGRLLHREIDVAGTIYFEQSLPQSRAYIPVLFERIHISHGDAASQVAINVLQIFGFGAVDIARQVEVEFVLLDFFQG